MANNVIEKSGSWFSYKGERIGQGRENARQFLKDHPDMWTAVDSELRRLLGLIPKEPAVNGQPAAAIAANGQTSGQTPQQRPAPAPMRK